MNVYILEVAKRLAARGVQVDVFTRATDRRAPDEVAVSDRVTVRHVEAGPFAGLSKEQLPSQMCAFTGGVLRATQHPAGGRYDLVHSHYWLSGQVGWVAAERWGVPLVHSMHTMAKVKNLHIAHGDRAEPVERIIGEEQVVSAADHLVANTAFESEDLVRLYGADPARISIALPGVDLEAFRPGPRCAPDCAW
jgi:D-inositol-3-phosphate glycosyltransferase